MANDKFIQPLEGIEITPGDGPNTLLSPEVLERAAARIAAGEDRDQVLTELAMEIVELEDGLREDGILAELKIPEEVLKVLARRGAPESPLHKVADAHQPKLEVALQYAFARARRALGEGQPNVDAAVKTLESALREVLPKMLSKVMVEGGLVAVNMMEFKVASAFRAAKKQENLFKFRFDAKNPRAAAWAREHGAWLIENITQTTREKIQAAVASVLEKGDWKKQWEKIARAVGDDDRAKLIAHTEVMTAVHAGQREAWEQAVDEGLLPSDARRTWIAVGDETMCPICEELDGAEADLDGKYPDPGEDGPPQHPRCRCSEGLA